MSSRRIRLAAASGPDSDWFRRLDKPPWYPPPQTFGIVWTGLYAGIGWAAGEVLSRSRGAQRRSFGRAYAVNLVRDTAWTPLFFRAHRPGLAAVESAVLTASSADLVRRAHRVGGRARAVLVPHVLWTAFAAVSSAAIARRNRAG